MLYLRNGRADWHGTKGIWVDMMLDPHCDFELWPHPWPWPLTFKVNFEKVITQEWDARLTWNERDVSRLNVGPMLWLSTLTSPMTSTLNFQHQILKLLYPRNGRADRHGTKGIWVDGGVIPTLWPGAMTLTLDFQGQTLKMLYLRNGRADWHGTKGTWVDRILDSHCDFELWPYPWPWPWILRSIFK